MISASDRRHGSDVAVFKKIIEEEYYFYGLGRLLIS
jgi:hypothetical protein